MGPTKGTSGSGLLERLARNLKHKVLSVLARPAGRVLLETFGDAKHGARDRGRICRELAQSLAHQDRVSEARIFAANGILAEPSDVALNRLNLHLTEAEARENLTEETISGLQAFCCFLGYPRSGHSVIAALLDAHPEVLISNELHALQFLDSELPPEVLFRMIAENSRIFAFAGRSWSSYSYAVPGMWQGCYRRLRIIGDKKGSRTTSVLQQNPCALEQFSQQIGKPIKAIHIYRNPFDNVATISRRNRLSVEAAADKYFSKADVIQAVKRNSAAVEIIDLAHESLIADPTVCLSQICTFLEVAPEPGYLARCAAVVYSSPHKSRHDVTWSQDQKQRLQDRVAAYPWLANYDFEC